MKNKYSTQQGGLNVIIIVLVVIALVGVLSWIVWHNFMATRTPVTSNPVTTQAVAESDLTDKFLTISEWGVKLPLYDNIKDISYQVESSGGMSIATFKSPQLPNCDYGTTGLIARSNKVATHYTAPDGADVTFTNHDLMIGGYYYVFEQPRAQCSSADGADIITKVDITKSLMQAFSRIEAV